MKRFGRLVGATMSVLGLALFLAAPAGAATAYHSVDHDGDDGWHARVTSAGGAVEFVNGPATPPMGAGSVHLTTGPGAGDGATEVRNTNFKDKKLSDLQSLSYWTYVHTNNGQQFPYLILDISTTGDNSPEDLLFFEPPYQSPGTGGATCANQAPTAMDTWQGWNARTGCWYAIDANSGNPSWASPGTGSMPLDDYISSHPGAKIVNPASGGGVRVLVGFASPEDSFDANVDAFRIGFGAGATQYDFEARG